MKYLLILIFCLLFSSPAWAEDTCLSCHQQETPGTVVQWQESAHSAAGIDCAACHGSDHEKIIKGEARVTADRCGKCHQQAYGAHRQSRHGLSLHAGWGCTRNLPRRDATECQFCHQEGSTLPVSQVQCARFLKQSSAMGEVGCNRCHMVENACGSCHSNHLTDLELVRDPQVCAKCHMGPDHPQWEIWQTSQHGQIWKIRGDQDGPTCQRCHMPQGSHDVSTGITATPAGQTLADDLVAKRRETMLAICTGCHAPGFARLELERGDKVRLESQQLVAEARRVIEDLADRSLLRPMPDQRQPHPLLGQQLVLGGQMLYEDISGIERLFFKMKKFDFAKTWKGAYHQNPAYAHWYGNAELKMSLVDIKSEADRLMQVGRGDVTSPLEPAKDAATVELERLKKKFDRGGMSAEDYQAAKTRILQGWYSQE